jgi:hypothetical protein
MGAERKLLHEIHPWSQGIMSQHKLLFIKPVAYICHLQAPGTTLPGGPLSIKLKEVHDLKGYFYLSFLSVTLTALDLLSSWL